MAVEPFRYVPAEEHHVRPRELESDASGVSTFYLTQEVGSLVAQALRKELARSGYEVREDGRRVISGVVERFRFDYLDPTDKTIELQVAFTIHGDPAGSHSLLKTCLERTSKQNVLIGGLIHAVLGTCLAEFIREAQDIGAL